MQRAITLMVTILFYAAFALGWVIISIWAWHKLAPASWRWLSAADAQSLGGFAFCAIIAYCAGMLIYSDSKRPR